MFNQKRLSISEILWMGITFWAIAFTAIEAPLSFIFKEVIEIWQLYVDGLICIIFFVDIVYHLRKKFLIIDLVSGERKKVKLSLKEKLTEALLFIIDIMACIPFEIISYHYGVGSDIQAFKLLRLIRLVRIIKIFSMMGTITILPKNIRIQMFIVCTSIVIHWITCGWMLIHPIIENMPNTDYYIRSLYWTITTLTTIGYGDITPSTNIGRLYTMVIMILGVGVYGVVIGNVSRILSLADRYKEKSKEKVNDLSSFMKYYNIPDRLQNSVFGYYNHLYAKRLSDNDTQIISDLPHALQQELQTYMNMKLIAAVPVFKGCSISCLKKISSALKQKFYSPGQTIIQIGELGNEMFIIGHGKVEVILKDGKPVATLHDGQFFGEIALIQETTRNANIRAQGYCDLYILEKEDFLDIIKEHPELLTNIENTTLKRSTDRRKN